MSNKSYRKAMREYGFKKMLSYAKYFRRREEDLEKTYEGKPFLKFTRFKENNVIKTCKTEGCNRNHHARGYCKKHYDMFMKHGDARKSLLAIDEKIYKKSLKKVDKWIQNTKGEYVKNKNKTV